MNVQRTNPGPPRVPARLQTPGIEVLVSRLYALAVDNPDQFAVIDGFGPLTYAELWNRARTTHNHPAPTRAGNVQPILGRPTANMLAHLLTAWLADTVPMPVPLGTPPATVTAAIHAAAATGDHSCGPWLAHLTKLGTVLLGGAPPTSLRTAAAFGLHTASSFLLGTDPSDPLAAELAIRQLALGGTVVLAGHDPDAWRTALALYRPTVTLVGAELVQRLHGTPHGLPIRLRADNSLRRILIPADAVQANADRLTPADPDVTVTAVYHRPGIGAATGTLAHGRTIDRTPFTAVPGTTLRVAGPTGGRLPAKCVGLLQASSDAGETAHCAGQPCTQAETWRTAGDLAASTADGGIILHRLHPPDTYTDIGGQRRTVDALTRIVQRIPGVAAVQVLAVPDADGITRAHLRIISHRPQLNAAAIAAACTAAGTPIPTRAITVTRANPA